MCLVWLNLPSDAAGKSKDTIQALLALCLLISIPCTIMYFILLGFHVYLYLLGYGTYEWMLRRRRAQRARTKANGDTMVPATSTSNISDAIQPDSDRQPSLTSVPHLSIVSAPELDVERGVPRSAHIIAL